MLALRSRVLLPVSNPRVEDAIGLLICADADEVDIDGEEKACTSLAVKKKIWIHFSS